MRERESKSVRQRAREIAREREMKRGEKVQRSRATVRVTDHTLTTETPTGLSPPACHRNIISKQLERRAQGCSNLLKYFFFDAVVIGSVTASNREHDVRPAALAMGFICSCLGVTYAAYDLHRAD